VLSSNSDSGFAGDHLRLISNQISELQQPEPIASEEPIEPDPDHLQNVSHSASAPIDTLPPPVPYPTSEMPRRKKGARHEKVSGLHIKLEQIKQHGFDHPVSSRHFLMVPPDDFLALLALEPLSVIQVVFLILRETVGWESPDGLHGRREWICISAQDFERRGVAGRAQARRGLKRAEEQGYIRKRVVGNGYEYAIRWARMSQKDPGS
jgi:hypothetical protein